MTFITLFIVATAYIATILWPHWPEAPTADPAMEVHGTPIDPRARLYITIEH